MIRVVAVILQEVGKVARNSHGEDQGGTNPERPIEIWIMPQMMSHKVLSWPRDHRCLNPIQHLHSVDVEESLEVFKGPKAGRFFRSTQQLCLVRLSLWVLILLRAHIKCCMVLIVAKAPSCCLRVFGQQICSFFKFLELEVVWRGHVVPSQGSGSLLSPFTRHVTSVTCAQN